jgi:selenocysteine lyase/cysteine desulfurase
LVDTLWDRHSIYIRNVTHEEIGWDVNRASLHIMVTAKQVDTLLGAIAEIAKKRPS